MKTIELSCTFCGKSYVVGIYNTKMYGVHIVSECPYCNKTYEGKLITLLRAQVEDSDEYSNKRIGCASQMIKLVQRMEKEVSPKPKKRIKNKKIYVEVEEDKFVEESKVPENVLANL